MHTAAGQAQAHTGDEVVLVPAGSLAFLPLSRLSDGERVSWVRRLPDAARLPPADRLLPALVEAVRTVVAPRRGPEA